MPHKSKAKNRVNKTSVNTSNKIAFILGMHRSGTSLLANICSELGYHPGNKLKPGSNDNPRGYWEDMDIYYLNNEILSFLFLQWDGIENQRYRKVLLFKDELWQKFGAKAVNILQQRFKLDSHISLKDPRFMILLPFWQTALKHFDADITYLLCVRNPLDVAKSLNKRNGITIDNGIKLWKYYHDCCFSDIDDNAYIYHYESVLKQAQHVISNINNILDNHSSADISGISKRTVFRELNHHSSILPETGKPGSLDKKAIELYRELLIKDKVSIEDGFLKTSPDNKPGFVADNESIKLDSTMFYHSSLITGDKPPIHISHKEGKNTLTFLLPKTINIDTIDLFLCDKPCILDIESIHLNNGNKDIQISNFTGNFTHQSGHIYIFASTIPRISIRLAVPVSIHSLEIKLHITLDKNILSRLLIPAFQNKLNRFLETEKKQELYAAEINQLKLMNINLDNEKEFFNKQLKNKENTIKELFEVIRSLEKENGIQKHTSAIQKNKYKRLIKHKRKLGRLYYDQKGKTEYLWELKNQYEKQLREAEKKSREMQNTIYSLNEDIMAFRTSLSWRLSWPFRYLAKTVIRIISGFRMFFKDIGYGFMLLRREGIKTFFFRLLWYLRGKRLEEDIFLKQNTKQISKISLVNDFKKLLFPEFDEILVTIIIPVYNQWKYTYNCLKSILENTNNIAYEIIIADDNSDDETTRIMDYVENIRLIRNKQNLHFVKNCNHAASYAKGKYIHFLNNDTIVHPGWLESLMNLFEKDDSIGIAGSKLLFPDGKLQEAGGIVWKDASAWNYGKWDQPDKPEYNYLRDTDYVSGASLCIRKNLWESLHGFDETFAPAYCEDSDLAFRARKNNFRIVYQPASVVTHFEGLSHGTDTDDKKNIKAQQVVNTKKFRQKWQDILYEEHFPNGFKTFKARDRNLFKKTIIIVDHYIPTFDQDAGGRTVYQYIKFFLEHKFKIILIGDNFNKSEPYTSHFQQMGVECWVGNWIASRWQEEIKKISKHIDYVFLNRPHISIKYLLFFRKNTNAKILYYGHDLHQLRLKREYELLPSEKIKKELAKFTEIENMIFRSVDTILYPSNIETEYLSKQYPEIKGNIRSIPAYIYTDRDTSEYDPATREGLFFIGGFRHPPNKDAMLWFLSQIFPIIQQKRPGIIIRIAGSYCPDCIKKYESDSVKILGLISDEELIKNYHTSRIMVAPLRVGAGVKGKIVESLHFGLPVITTNIGAEGIPDIENAAVISNTEQNFARAIIDYYDELEKLKTLSTNGKLLVKEHYSSKTLFNILKEEIEL